MRFLGCLLLVASWTFTSGDVLLFDCSEDTTGAELEIREVDPVGTVIARVSGSDGALQWSAILGGSRSIYLTQFFTSPKLSTMTTPGSAAASLTIARKVDLELLEYEIPNFWEYSRSNGDLTFVLEITCIAEDMPRRHNVHVTVLAVNEFYPQFLRAPYQMAVSEAVEPGAELFSLTSLVTDMDAGDSNFTFAIKPYMISQFDGSRYVTISESGDVTLAEPLDFELLPVGRNYMFVNVTVKDDGGLLTSTSINLTVLDANDQGVELVFPGCPQPCLEANYSADVNVSYIGEVSLLPVPLTAMDLDALNETVVYYLDTDETANFFRMDERTGRLYKTAVLGNDTLGPRFVLNVRVEEASESSHFLLTTVTILVPERQAAATPSTVVPPHQRTDIECLPDAISIFLPETLLPERRNITWREEMCKADFNGTHYVSVIALSECGTTVSIQNDTVTFYNELIVRKVADDIQDVNSDSDVTYGSDYETVIPVQCIYPRHSNVSSSYIPVKQNVRFFEKHYGDLDVYMQQFDSEDFKFTIPVDGSPRKVPLNDDLYIRVGLNFDPVDVRVKADQCIATSSPNPADSHWRQLINDGCPVNNVRLLTGSDSSDVKFTLKAFDFRHNASGFVYLHCQVSICGAVDDRCRMGCSARVKRSASGSDRTLLVSTGPFYVERRNQNNAVQESLTAQTIVAAVCFLVAIVAVIMAVIGWKRPRDPKSTNF